jgi:hypothetical protein
VWVRKLHSPASQRREARRVQASETATPLFEAQGRALSAAPCRHSPAPSNPPFATRCAQSIRASAATSQPASQPASSTRAAEAAAVLLHGEKSSADRDDDDEPLAEIGRATVPPVRTRCPTTARPPAAPRCVVSPLVLFVVIAAEDSSGARPETLCSCDGRTETARPRRKGRLEVNYGGRRGNLARLWVSLGFIHAN